MTETELQEIEKRCESATPGPWSDGVAGHAGVVHFNGDDIVYVASAKPHDRAFIVGARTDIPALLSTVRELQRQIQEREADARRYRWLRDGYDGTVSKAGRPVIVCNVAGEIPELDTAIDNAMSGSKTP